jgi:hypothetical protein
MDQVQGGSALKHDPFIGTQNVRELTKKADGRMAKSK